MMNRLLALDGGGMRGVFTLEILQRVQGFLRDRYDNPKLVLADYFNFIGAAREQSLRGCFPEGDWSKRSKLCIRTWEDPVFNRPSGGKPYARSIWATLFSKSYASCFLKMTATQRCSEPSGSAAFYCLSYAMRQPDLLGQSRTIGMLSTAGATDRISIWISHSGRLVTEPHLYLTEQP